MKEMKGKGERLIWGRRISRENNEPNYRLEDSDDVP